MNVSILRRNKVDIALASYVMKPLKSTYLQLSVLVADPFIRPTEMRSQN